MEADYTQLVRDFLRRVQYQPPPYHYDLGLEDTIVEYFASQGFPVDFVNQLRPAIQWAAGFTLASYPRLSREAQRGIAIYSAYVIVIDDRAAELAEDLQQFLHRLFQGQPSQSQLLRCFVRFLHQDLSAGYGQFARDMILKGTTDFIAVCYLEVQLAGIPARSLPPEAQGYPQYLRLKSGLPEVYAYLAFPTEACPEDPLLAILLPAIPEYMLFINAVNDIFSFYKESIIGDETTNFVSNLALVNAMTPLQAVEQVCQAATAALHRTYGILAPATSLQRTIDQFCHGYILYHLSQTRYRLNELDLPEVQEAKALMKATLFSESSEVEGRSEQRVVVQDHSGSSQASGF